MTAPPVSGEAAVVRRGTYERVRDRTFEILERAEPGDETSRVVDLLIVTLIALNVAALILESVPWIDERMAVFFGAFEAVSIAVFTAEYVLRIWSATADERHRRPVVGRVRYALTPMLIIDALAVLPFYLPLLGLDLRFLRALRMMRVFRLLKLGRYSRATRTISLVIRRKKEELVVTLSLVGLLLIIASSFLYLVESEAQPEAFSSIPSAMWWGIVTLSTVGYGDVYPVTVLGRLIGAVVAVLGIGMFALPAGILGGAFLEQIEADDTGSARDSQSRDDPGGARDSRERSAAATASRCPHCGGRI